MGCDTFVTCPKCRVTVDCGYGSYRSHDNRAEKALHDHAGHGAISWSSDYTFHLGDDLMIDGAGPSVPEAVLVADEKNFRREDGTARTDL